MIVFRERGRYLYPGQQGQHKQVTNIPKTRVPKAITRPTIVSSVHKGHLTYLSIHSPLQHCTGNPPDTLEQSESFRQASIESDPRTRATSWIKSFMCFIFTVLYTSSYPMIIMRWGWGDGDADCKTNHFEYLLGG